jgi:hypothetical protein
MSDDLFTDFERLETCRRAEVTEDNLHLLARHLGGTAVYGADPNDVQHARRKPHILLSSRFADDESRVIEVGSWVDERGNRWNPEPLTQGWSPAGTFVRAFD